MHIALCPCINKSNDGPKFEAGIVDFKKLAQLMTLSCHTLKMFVLQLCYCLQCSVTTMFYDFFLNYVATYIDTVVTYLS